MGKFDRYAFSAAPSFDEAATRRAFARAVPLRTLVIYCYDPRAAEVPAAVAKRLGDEVFPGEVIRDDQGKRVASTTTLFPVIVAGGRAIDALRSITVAQHLFGNRNSICIRDYEASLKHDTALIRAHPGTPGHAAIFGYFYDIDTGELTEVVRDEAKAFEPA